MTREVCEKRLVGDVVGGFIVRESKGRKVLSVKMGMEEIKHIPIHKEEGGWTLDKKIPFELVEQLIGHYKENILPGSNLYLK